MMMVRSDGGVRRFVLSFCICCESAGSTVATAAHSSGHFSKTRKKGSGEEKRKWKKKERVSKASLMISKGFHRFFIRFKSFSPIFFYKEEKMEQMEKEMEIGFPTDVKHVTHIGMNGSSSINPISNWENFEANEKLSFPSISFHQFQVAMAAQSHSPLPRN